MAAEKDEAHRPGAFKQQNKTHKTGRHRSKGQLEKATKGRVNAKSLSRRSAKKAMGRQQRRSQALQIRKQKRDEIMNRKRSRGGSGSPPFLVTVVCLCDGVDTDALLKLLQTCDDTTIVRQNDLDICHISVPRFKQRYEFVCPAYGNLYALLDAVKVADCLLLVVTPNDAISSYGELCLSTVFTQGLPASVLAIQGMKDLSVKKQSEVRHSLQKRMEKRFPAEKLHTVDTSQDALLLLRTIGNQKLPAVSFRDLRPYLMAEDIKFELPDEQSTTGTLRVTGYLRGRALSVNGLVHLAGWGDFQMSQIDAASDPYTITATGGARKKGSDSMEMETEEGTGSRLLEKADPGKQESLMSEVVPDPMEGEQTWPTEEELTQAAMETKKTRKLVPKGTSEYQAAWIIEDEEEEEEDSEDEDDEDEEMEGVGEEESDSEGDGEEEEEEEEELDTVSISESNNTVKYDATVDVEEERRFLEKLQAARSDQIFPDEVDTPRDISASVRFQRYRGLKSFRTSPWDPKENLPHEYAKIFQFGNYRRTCRRVLADKNEDGAQPGWYITIHVQDVPREFMESYSTGHPVVIFGLLPHEQKMSVVNMMVRPVGGTPQCLLKSKERVIFHVGYRRFAASPMYSEHTNGDKHKYERFMHGTTVVATVYAPIMFPPAGVMMFKEKTNGEHELVATGRLISVNPDRVVIKRIVLSGHPFKINAKSATVRYMFYNREDIAWFSPVELRTKWGRRGHIKEGLGTHGHMKCVFDGQLRSQDTILMNLYKRVYPKWTYEGVVRAPVTSTSALHGSTSALQDIAMSEMFD